MSQTQRKKLCEKLTVQIDEDLHAMFEAHAQRVEQRAGVRVSRGEIARRLIEVGLKHFSD